MSATHALVRLSDQPGCADLEAVVFAGSEEECTQAKYYEPEPLDATFTLRIVEIERTEP